MNLKGIKKLSKNEQKMTFGGMMNTCAAPTPSYVNARKDPIFIKNQLISER